MSRRKWRQKRVLAPIGSDARPGVLYRHFDKDGRLLYIGESCRILDRVLQHEKDARWFKEIVSITLEHFPTRLAARVAEKPAIAAEKPLYNIIGNRPRPCRPAVRETRWTKEARELDEQIARILANCKP